MKYRKNLAQAIAIACVLIPIAKAGAATAFSDDFNSNTVGAAPTGWTFTTDGWGNSSLAVIANDSTASGNRAVNIPDAADRGGNMTMAASLGTPLTVSWAATFDYAFHWGDGNPYVGVGISLRSPTAADATTYDGYRYMIWMGDDTAPEVGKDSTGRFQIESYNGQNTPSGTALVAATGTYEGGYWDNNAWGTWSSLNPDAPGSVATVDTMNHGKLTWDAATHTLTAFFMPAGGSTWVQTAQVVDLSASSFSEVGLSYVGHNGVTTALDNVVVTTVPEPASLAGMGVGIALLMRRRGSSRLV